MEAANKGASRWRRRSCNIERRSSKRQPYVDTLVHFRYFSFGDDVSFKYSSLHHLPRASYLDEAFEARTLIRLADLSLSLLRSASHWAGLSAAQSRVLVERKSLLRHGPEVPRRTAEAATR